MSGHGRTVARLAAMVVGMFGFGFALVPLYDVLCELTGLGGRTGGPYEYDAASAIPDRSRLVKVNFITNTNAGMTWEFRAETGGVTVHPGELTEVSFYVRNPTNRTIVGQAVPSLVPQSAAAHFHKTECFCFERQTLGPGESLKMPMRFIVGPELPANVQSISLSYALFDVTELAAGAAANDSGQRI
ncbi:MAG: cytochrome c oxidase assembly protein [Gammaproteobacteria bacterium]|nr:MAG: cytochrome c oxidase assembly protein [Gammaproteobacteria bacterium]